MNTRFAPQLPRQVQTNLKSIGPLPKRVATIVNDYSKRIGKYKNISFTTNSYSYEAKIKNRTNWSLGLNYYNNNGNMGHPEINDDRSTFRQESFMAEKPRRIYVENLYSGSFFGRIFRDKMQIFCRDNRQQDEFHRNCKCPPKTPCLEITKDTGVWQTVDYNPFNEDLSSNIASQRDFVEYQWQVGSPEAIYAKQYKMINKFMDKKAQVFDSPVELATKAYEKMKNEPYNSQGDIDITAQGERMYVLKKQIEQDDGGIKRDAFDIILYDEENQMAMSGTFTVVRDENGKPLKEAEDGKILKFGDPNYNDTQKLCFDISLSTYFPDTETEQKELYFQRYVCVQNGKYKHTMKLDEYDKKGDCDVSTEVKRKEAFSRYSKDWLDKRYPKVYHNVTKHDLKAAKSTLLRMRLNPADVGLPFDEQNSIISQINADNIDSNVIRTPQPVAQEDQEAQDAQNTQEAQAAQNAQEAQDAQNAAREAFLANLAQEKPESYAAFRNYLANMEPEERNSILDFSVADRPNILRNLLRRNAPEAIEAFEAIVDFMNP